MLTRSAHKKRELASRICSLELLMPIINSEPRAKEIRITRSMGKALHIMGFPVRIQKPRKIRMRRATVGIPMHRDPSPEMHRDPSPETYRPRSSSLSCSSSKDVWCNCRQPDDGTLMIACDNKNCQVQWYHIKCLGIDNIPEGAWYCSDCI